MSDPPAVRSTRRRGSVTGPARPTARLALVALVAIALAGCGQGLPSSPSAVPAETDGTPSSGAAGHVPSAPSGAATSAPAVEGSSADATTSPAVASARPSGATPTGCDLPPVAIRAAQTLLVGVPGTMVAQGGADVVHEGVGGVLLFGGNLVDAAQLRTLTRGLQAAAEIPLAFATDEEPGRIGRLAAAGIIAGTPSARDLGTQDPAAVKARALAIGRALVDLGLTVDLAPVLDVTGAPGAGVIGDRSFGADPGTVSRAGVAFAAGLAAAGIAAVGKHFPGHGETTTDSHTSLPVVTASLETLRRRALPPFEAAVKAGIPAIMLGHLQVDAIDPSRPSSLSARTIELLRRDLGFTGLVMTDDMYMGGIAERWDVSTAVELAIRAGVDMVILSTSADVPAVKRALVRAVEAGRLPESRLTDAFLRVERFKGVHRWAACEP